MASNLFASVPVPASSFSLNGDGVLSVSASEAQLFSLNGRTPFLSLASFTPSPVKFSEPSFEHWDGASPVLANTVEPTSTLVRPSSADLNSTSSTSSLVRKSHIARKTRSQAFPTAPSTPRRVRAPSSVSPLDALLLTFSSAPPSSPSSSSTTTSSYQSSLFASGSECDSDADDDSLLSAFSSPTSSACTTPEPSSPASARSFDLFTTPSSPSPLCRRDAIRRPGPCDFSLPLKEMPARRYPSSERLWRY
ncbi:hypothetical protein JCM8097_006881 [Rhodosporidiobolus ruineniae]